MRDAQGHTPFAIYSLQLHDSGCPGLFFLVMNDLHSPRPRDVHGAYMLGLHH